MDATRTFPPADEVEELKAFAFIAGYELTSAGQGWTDGTGVIHGMSWSLKRNKKHGRVIASWEEYCPTMENLREAITLDTARLDRNAKANT